MKVNFSAPAKPEPVASPPVPVKTLGVDDAISLVNTYFADRHVEQQTIALLQHLSERLAIAESNQAALMNALQLIANDSSTSRDGLLTAISSISERLAEAPQVNVTVPVPEVTVPVPEVNVNVEAPESRKVITLQRDQQGFLVGGEIEPEPES